VDIYHHPELYRPLSEGRALMEARAMPLDSLKDFNAEADVREKLRPYPDADAWMPLMSNAQPMTVLLNKKEARVLAIVDLQPWN
jgi:hypothetical protein